MRRRKSMFGIDKIKQLVKTITRAVTKRRQKKLAEVAEIERREREAIVKRLAIKFAEAHADCAQNNRNVTLVELSLKEILVIERDLETWARHFRERKIYERLPQR
jgi:hypothetical protein